MTRGGAARSACAAALLEGVPLALLWLGAHAAYGAAPSIAWGPRPAALWAALGLAGPAAGAATLAGVYRLHRDHPVGPAVLWTALAFVPLLAVASAATLALAIVVGLW